MFSNWQVTTESEFYFSRICCSPQFKKCAITFLSQLHALMKILESMCQVESKGKFECSTNSDSKYLTSKFCNLMV